MDWITDEQGRAYHLNINREEASDLILLVGDPERVPKVSKHFDEITLTRTKREFVIHQGKLAGRQIMVMSTGIGGPNIEIVFNELDALFNLNQIEHHQLTFIRLGTSGSVNPEVKIGEIITSEQALGLDGIVHFYPEFKRDKFIKLKKLNAYPWGEMAYSVLADKDLLNIFSKYKKAFTATLPGFYAPQGRKVRAQEFGMLKVFENLGVDNLEMETAMIYAMAKLFGHKALSLSLILANRSTNTFSEKPKDQMENFLSDFFNILRKNINQI